MAEIEKIGGAHFRIRKVFGEAALEVRPKGREDAPCTEGNGLISGCGTQPMLR